VVAQVVVFIADQHVVDHALEQFGVVHADDAVVAVLAHRLREVSVGLGWRLGLVAVGQRETADEPEPVLCLVDVNYPDRSATTILAGGSGE
jgi:hypothetical protein